MLKLRKILLCNLTYIIILFLAIFACILRINLKKTSSYHKNNTQIKGIITKIILKDEKLTLYIKNKETIIASTYKYENLPTFSLGDELLVSGKLEHPPKNNAKYLFNYQEYLKHQNIYYLLNIESLKITSKNKNIYYYLKQKLINYIGSDCYLITFILGDKTYLSTEAKRSFQENGISHLFAISGMHITLLSTIIEKILKRFKLTEENIFKITISILLIYLLVVGIQASILRGILFYLLFKLNKIYYFYISKINLFILAISITILVKPNSIFDIGFQYSYLISLALLLSSNILNQKSYLKSLFIVSIISFTVSLPITLINFYQINILSIIYNLIYVPLVSIIIFPLSLLTLLVKPLLPIFKILTFLLEKSSIIISKIKFGKIIFKRIPNIIYIFYLLLILIYLIKKLKLPLIILILCLLIHYFIAVFDNSNYLYILDVGQGDSIFLHSNNKNILIDTGGKSDATNDGKIIFNTTLPILKSLGIKKIDYLIITHGDFDHMGEAISLVENFKVEKVIFNCGDYNTLEKKLINVLDKKRIKQFSCISELNLPNSKLTFLNTKEYDNENDNSNVIYTELNKFKFMFMGDASSLTEKEILEEYSLPSIDVLKVGHHGSHTSSSKEFINTINPKYSLISCGKDNKFGHPNKEVLKNLTNSKIYRTDTDGSIMFKIEKDKLVIETCPS